MNAKEREGGRRRRGMMTEERSKRKRDEDGLSRGQRKEECIPGRVNPWGLEWLTIPWIRAFHASSTNSCAFPRTCNQRRGNQPIPISSSSSAIDSTILNIARLPRKWIVIRGEGGRSRRVLRLHAFLSKGGEVESLTRSLP